MSKKKRVRAKRTTNSYLKSAKDNKTYIPSLQKYSRRKTLTRWEKSAITRAEKKLRDPETGRKLYNLAPVSKKQAKALGKKALLGNGIQAIQIEGFGRDNRLSIENGKPVIKSKNRKIHLVELPLEINAYIDIGADLFNKAIEKNKHLTIWFWWISGRGKDGFTTFEVYLDEVDAIFAGFDQDEDIDDPELLMPHTGKLKYPLRLPDGTEILVGIQYLMER